MAEAVGRAGSLASPATSPHKTPFSVRRFSSVAEAFGDLPLEKACDWATGATAPTVGW